MPFQVIMPKLGEMTSEATITKWLHNEGERVEEFEPLLEVNTAMLGSNIPSPTEGILLKVLHHEGETVKAGTLLAWIGESEELYEMGGGDPGLQQQTTTPEDDKPTGDTEPINTLIPDHLDENQAEEPVTEAITETITETPITEREEVPSDYISPAVAQLLNEHHLEIDEITGSGENGRVTRRDVLEHLEQTSRVQAEQETAQPAPVITESIGEHGEQSDEEPLENTENEDDAPSPIEETEKISNHEDNFESMEIAYGNAVLDSFYAASADNINTDIPEAAIEDHLSSDSSAVPAIPQATITMEVDLRNVVMDYHKRREAFASDGAQLTYTVYFIAAIIHALKKTPQANAAWGAEGIEQRPHIHIGLGTVQEGEENLVPVIENADSLSLLGIARAITEVSQHTREQQPGDEDPIRGTLTVVDFGADGVLFAIPQVLPQQAVVLGTGLVKKRAVIVDGGDPFVDDAIAVRPMVYLSLSYDTRVLDSGTAADFLKTITHILEKWKQPQTAHDSDFD